MFSISCGYEYFKKTLYLFLFVIFLYGFAWCWNYYQIESDWNERVARMTINCRTLPKFVPKPPTADYLRAKKLFQETLIEVAISGQGTEFPPPDTTGTMLLFIAKFFERWNITYWINRGSLLGSLRYGKVIPWDDDGDISITLDGTQQFVCCNHKIHAEIEELMKEVQNEMGENVPALYRSQVILTTESNKNELKRFSAKFPHHHWKIYVDFTGPFLVDPQYVKHRNPRKADLDTSWIQGRQTWNYSTIFPLSRCPWYSESVYCPHQAVEYTERMYGKGAVQQPKKLF